MLICTFVGHRDPLAFGLSERLSAVLEDLVHGENELVFYVGGHGGFDSIGAEAVRRLQATHVPKNIRLILVLPYMMNRLNQEKQRYTSAYDEVFVLSEASAVYPKRAITVRNRWMVDQADVIVSCVQRDYGGAYQTLQYAKCSKKRIVEVTDAKKRSLCT